ncbi:alkaline phosphatase [Tsuneonella rigui]|uniref:alkaline phosphatase n=1 Tax=Tsuneonella rigui TaxID=1708790 RepID=UPI0019D0A31E|nr:alkaline phosphatase [Tsuneonella rigui]
MPSAFIRRVLMLAALGTAPGAVLGAPAATTDEYRAQGEAQATARRAPPKHGAKAKNLIIFIGDGMGVSTITAGRIWQGQAAGQDGESTQTAMDSLDYAALVKTYGADAQVSDSAPTATAFMTGVKANEGAISVGPESKVRDCASSKGHELRSILALAQDAGLATGVISTARITHATPAASYAHTPGRDWESDKELPAEAAAQGCKDIARQFIEGEVGPKLQVAIGGGRSMFMPANAADPEYPTKTGSRKDGRDLVGEWAAAHPGGTYAWNAAQFAAWNAEGKGPLFALFEPSHMQYEADRAGDPAGEPALADMVEKAIRHLSRTKKGYVLYVEGGRIDHAHHAGNAYRALVDTVALDNAVARALSRVDLDDTLIVSTADHSHTLTINGYPSRGNPILDTVKEGGKPVLDANGKQYTTLSYANGSGAVKAGGKDRPDPATEDTDDHDYRQQSLVPLIAETHGGEDVAVRASGPGADQFRGTIEQHTIFYLMRNALLGSKGRKR